jgi:predicted dehydrogenase
LDLSKNNNRCEVQINCVIELKYFKRLSSNYNMEPLKIGFIGAKGRGMSLFQSLMMNESTGDLVEPVAVCDVRAENMAEWKYLVDVQTTDFEKFINVDMDAVVIASPASTHVELSLKLLNAGIDVWCEVPMAYSMDGVLSLIDADKSNKNNGKFTYLENYCWMIQPQFCAKHHKEGDFGDIYYCEGEYSHSVEHYLMRENYEFGHEYDPDEDYGKGMGDPIPGKPGMREWMPTWRGRTDGYPILYPHAYGPLHYVLNAKKRDRPVEVQAVGNKIMKPHRLRGQTFNLGLITMESGAICKIVRGDILKTHRIAYNFWGSGALFEGASNQLSKHAKDMVDRVELQQKHHWYPVPVEKRRFPERHLEASQLLTDEDLVASGIKTAAGGHYGADSIMFESIVTRKLENKPQELDVYAGAEQMAPLILGVEALLQKRAVEVPKFD